MRRRAPPSAAPWPNAQIGEAAKKLWDASYPLLKNIDWLSNMYTKPLPGTSVIQSLKAVDTTIVMGNARYGNLLKAAAEANHKAIGSIDAKGVTAASDYEAVNSALGYAGASVPTSKVMDDYSAGPGILNEAVPNKLVSAGTPLAAKAFWSSRTWQRSCSGRPFRPRPLASGSDAGDALSIVIGEVATSTNKT